MAITEIPAAGHTCTVAYAVGMHCGKPAVLGLRTSRGEEFFECAEHAMPIPAPTTAPAKKAAARVKCRACGHVHTYGPCGVRMGKGRMETCDCTQF